MGYLSVDSGTTLQQGKSKVGRIGWFSHVWFSYWIVRAVRGQQIVALYGTAQASESIFSVRDALRPVIGGFEMML